jgi:hypothetical protein
MAKIGWMFAMLESSKSPTAGECTPKIETVVVTDSQSNNSTTSSSH